MRATRSEGAGQSRARRDRLPPDVTPDAPCPDIPDAHAPLHDNACRAGAQVTRNVEPYRQCRASLEAVPERLLAPWHLQRRRMQLLSQLDGRRLFHVRVPQRLQQKGCAD